MFDLIEEVLPEKVVSIEEARKMRRLEAQITEFLNLLEESADDGEPDD